MLKIRMRKSEEMEPKKFYKDYVIEGEEEGPNKAGYYEVYVGQRYTLPPGFLQSSLEDAGYRYFRQQPGKYDIELWSRKETITHPEAVETVVVKEGEVTEFEVKGKELARAEFIKPLPFLVSTTRSCQYCGMRIDVATFQFGNPDSSKIVQTSMCTNPLCNYHYTEVRKQ